MIVLDWRGELPRAAWSIGERIGTTSITVHWFGARVPDNRQAELAALKGAARLHMKPGHISEGGADGLQYHYAVLSDGVVVQVRDENAKLWHAAAAEPNEYGLAVLVTAGPGDAMTDMQRQSLLELLDAKRVKYNLNRTRVRGHGEWSPGHTACPGAQVLQVVRDYRSSDSAVHRGVYRVRVDANLREGPGTHYPVVEVMPANFRFEADTTVHGELVDTDNDIWVHRLDGRGFVWSGLCDRV